MERKLEPAPMISTCARVCVRWLVPGRKEGRKEVSKTWLTVDRRSHQDTSPFLFLSLRFIETRRTIILFFLSRERETSLSLSLLSCPGGEKAFSIAVGTKLWSRNCGARRGKTKSGEEGRKNPAADRAGYSSKPKDRTRRKFFLSFSLSELDLLLLLLVITPSRLLARFSN